MKTKPSLWLSVALMMFPQIVETIYSPALTNIAAGFSVSSEQAAQTLSLYFFAFALGVVVWGRMCDVIGRRPTIIAGLLLYGLSSLLALLTQQFWLLLIARMLSAFGAAVGSVGTQTIMRDSYQGDELARIFSVMGIALAISPALGMVSGSTLNYFAGYKAVFTGLAILAVLLTCWSVMRLPETRPANVKKVALLSTARMMLKDISIWRNAFLIAFFNICLFSYYQLAPFRFEHFGLSQAIFGYTGLLLTLGVGFGSLLNKYLLKKQWRSPELVALAAVVTLLSGLCVYLLENSWLFIFPMLGIVTAYGLAIPNILASALSHYGDRLGTAGALLGLFYYLLLGIGLALAGWSQALGGVLICCGMAVFFLTRKPSQTNLA
ncbi:Bcr/CflA family efflux MFS transporter [Xenorhabdus szentirmaii]|uniref:Bcr/CflA family efflux MFS transporter n=1 Tax=Xenorhabdus szentirmaii TaxID=290112 RepID=UPI0019AE278D|nr:MULTISPECIES: Bcr/CflA family efflux MFS transporter [unclassified Xenorhabdus]MBD2791213.1 Bcr/CflA family efflux MFS transporter [Xenorhabdus sp. CUL]MBD2825696.1 Bcr/CflA family efflux MFS transporter [Xenorhabdus sp. 5]